VKELGGQAIANLLIAALTWLKNDGSAAKFYHKDGSQIELSPKDLPDNIVVNVSLEPDVPSDRLQQANIAQLITSGGANALASKRWARENVMPNMGQSDEMDKEIYMEMRTSFELQRLIDALKAQDQMGIQAAASQLQMALQAQMAQAQQQAQNGPPPPGTIEGGVMPPPEAQNLPPGTQGPPPSAGGGFPPGAPPPEMQGPPPEVGGRGPGGAYAPGGIGPGQPLRGPLPVGGTQGA
jgi:hypothetical protein